MPGSVERAKKQVATRTMVAPLAVPSQSSRESTSPRQAESTLKTMAHQNMPRDERAMFLADHAGVRMRGYAARDVGGWWRLRRMFRETGARACACAPYHFIHLQEQNTYGTGL